jgi:hypothetical protein
MMLQRPAVVICDDYVVYNKKMWALDRPRKHERDAVYYDDDEGWEGDVKARSGQSPR